MEVACCLPRECDHLNTIPRPQGPRRFPLNKPMVDPDKTHPLVIAWFRFAEVLQVIMMAFVAGQEGCDGIILVVLVWSFNTFYGCYKHAARWLQEERLRATAFGCKSPGRTELLGVVQLLSTGKTTYWVDGILAPVKRREVWLEKVGVIDSGPINWKRSSLRWGSMIELGSTQLECRPLWGLS